MSQEIVSVVQQAAATSHEGSANLQIKPYQLEALSAILDLTRTTLGDSGAVRKTEAFWSWKHQANPFGPSYGLYAWDEAKQIAAGLRVLMRWGFKTPTGEWLQAVRAVDTATHPAYQRQGIFSKLTQQAVAELTEAGVQLIFNTPNQRSLPGYLKMGWQVVAKWPIYLKILRPVRLLAGLFRRQAAQSPLPFEAYFKPGVLTWEGFAGRYRGDIQAAVSAWEMERVQVGLRTWRNFSYLQWRYGQHPHLRYGIYALEKRGALAGFAVLRPNLRFGLKEIVLTEIFLREPDLKLGRLLLQNLSEQLKGDYLVAHFARGTLEHKLLGRSGFLRIPKQGMLFTVRPLNPTPDNLLQAANWDLSLGDLEIF